ncbi:MAG: LysE family translocator [Paracoccaceae bacterium]
MEHDLFLALIAFAFVTSVTPGPNNMMLLASGANFGFVRSVPHMLGISVGHMVMTLIVGLGLVGVMLAVPATQVALKVVSVAYMLWLAWKLAHAGAPGEEGASARPMSFLQAAAFQWVNPKAWAMSLGAVAAYAPDQSLGAVAMVAGVFAAVNLPSVSVWTAAGGALRRFLTSPARLAVFNWTMAVLLVVSLVPVLWH